MQTLLLEPGDLLQIKSTDLPPGQFIKLQAQSTSFLDISDPKAVLENAFRNFSCLTKGDVFTFAYNLEISLPLYKGAFHCSKGERAFIDGVA